MAVHSLAVREVMETLLDASRGPYIQSLSPADVLAPSELASARWSFFQLAARVAARDQGILMGWWRLPRIVSTTPDNCDRRGSSALGETHGHTVVNPPKKARPLRWSQHDALIVLK